MILLYICCSHFLFIRFFSIESRFLLYVFVNKVRTESVTSVLFLLNNLVLLRLSDAILAAESTMARE